MSLFDLKLVAIAIILATAILGGLAALRAHDARNADRFFTFGALFGGGVFLGAGLIHMLPDAVSNMSRVYPDLDYPVPYALAALGLVAILAIDRFGHALGARADARVADATHDGGGVSAVILLVVLSFHSILAGAAIGAEDSAANAIVLLLAIIAHKGSAAFALTTGLLRSPLGARSVWPPLLLFSTMTPAGILLGAGLQELLAGSGARISEAVFDALAAATFVYVATLEVIGPEFRTHGQGVGKLVALSSGLGVMALVALWL